MYLHLTEPKGWVTDMGEFGANAIIVFDFKLLSDKQWNIVDNLHESDRMKYIKAVLTGDKQTARSIARESGIE